MSASLHLTKATSGSLDLLYLGNLAIASVLQITFLLELPP